MAPSFLAAALAALLAQAADAQCHIGKVADLPITMSGLRPLIPVKINGQDAKLVLDSGAFFSMISLATAGEFKLRLSPAPPGFTITGIGGSTNVQIASVKEFSFAGVTIKNIEFMVGGGEVGSAGLLGQNFLEKYDVEYDLAKGAIRLFKTEGCERANLAYWLAPGQPFSVIDIDRIDPLHPHTIGAAEVNGGKIRVAFDTGAFTSILSLRAAERAGMKPESPGVIDGGYGSGIGRTQVKTYVGTFSSFKIGAGEEIQHARLRFADIQFEDADMLMGADFFISHRIFVANKEHRLFLTYNGGPVFDLTKRTSGPSSANSPDPEPAKVPPGASGEPAGDAETASADPAELARRGSAHAARGEFVPALADLSKAVDLRPDEPEYHFQRANAYRASGQVDPALADLDRVIALEPGFLPAYIPRAEIKLSKHASSSAIEDLDAVDRLAPRQADLRLRLAEIDELLDRTSAAIEQFGLWIQFHPDDSRMAGAMSQRCFNAALANQDLGAALSDCNSALRRVDKTNGSRSHFYANRALVRLRQGDYAKVIADCNDALKILPSNAPAHFYRAVAEARQSKKSESDADLLAARNAEPGIAAHFEHFGIIP